MRASDWPCPRCDHPASWHRLDDSTNVSPVDPEAKFRCIGYDCERPGRPADGPGCDCPDFVESEGYCRQLDREGSR